MSNLATPDGKLAVFPDGGDRLSLAFPLTDLSPEAIEQLTANPAEAPYRLYGRSVLGQMGVDIFPAPAKPVIANRLLYAPVELTAHCAIGRLIVEDLGNAQSRTKEGSNLRINRKTIELGRFVNFGELRRLDGKDETERAIADGLLAFDTDPAEGQPGYRVNDDGSLTLPIARIETLLNHFTLRTQEQRMNAIRHGRAGLISHTDTIDRSPDDVLPDFLVGGVALSAGPFHCVIRDKLDEAGQLRQLVGAALLDGNRLMGIGRTLDRYSRHRQLEVVNSGSQQTFGNTEVTIDIYRSNYDAVDLHPVVDWWRMDLERRHKLHRQGVNPLDVIKAANPAAREQLFSVAAEDGRGGIVMSAHGISEVSRGRTDRLMTQNTIEVARSFGRDREVPQQLRVLEPFKKALGPAGDRSRLFVGDKILAEDMAEIVKGGDVRTFLVKSFGNIAMTKQEHNALVRLAQSGVAIGWDNQGELREFHRSGVWIKPDQVERMEELDLVWAMYGTHKSAIDTELWPRIEDFFLQMVEHIPVQRMGVTHGNGPGVMRMADELARQHGIMSLGVGIDVEDIGQGKAKLLADAVAYFKTSERLYRQEMMDKFRTIAVFNVGGFGTLEETAVTLCTNKLGSALPSPSIIVDPDKLCSNVVAQIKEISSRTHIKLFGKTVDISHSPLGQAWVSNTVHHVDDYEKAATVIKDFWDSPAAYWDRAGIPGEAIAMAYHKHCTELERMGMRMAEHISRAARLYGASV